MNGYSLLYNLNNILRESSLTSSFLDVRSSYTYIYEAVREYSRRTKTLTSSQTISTISGVTRYDLPTNFNNLYFRDDRNRLIIKYTTSSGSDNWLPFRQYDAMSEAGNTASVSVPNTFSISDEQTLKSRITGTASIAGAVTLEETTLTDTSSSTKFSNANIGDNVTNITDGSAGVIIEKTSNTALVTVLFGGTNNDWTASDSYVIVPQSVKQVILDPPPSNTGDTIYIPYLEEPTPVFSSYRTYRIDDQYELALSFYAAWLYKYKDSKSDEGDKWYKIFDDKIRKATKEANKQLGRNTFRVNLQKRSFRDRSMR
jgi:hypothetical protein